VAEEAVCLKSAPAETAVLEVLSEAYAAADSKLATPLLYILVFSATFDTDNHVIMLDGHT